MTIEEIIKQHLEGWRKVHISSAVHYAESGKLSGTLLNAVKEAMDEYAEQQCAEQRKVSAEVYTDMARFQYKEAIEIAIIKTKIPK